MFDLGDLCVEIGVLVVLVVCLGVVVFCVVVLGMDCCFVVLVGDGDVEIVGVVD